MSKAMSKTIGGPITKEERSATRATDLWKGMDCGKFDPEKSDHIHGRGGSPALLFDRMKGVKVHGCEACVFGERYKHTCGIAAYASDGPILTSELRRAGRLEASC